MKNVPKIVLFILVTIIIIVIGIICFKQIKGNEAPLEYIEKYKPLENLSIDADDFSLPSIIENKYYLVMLDNIVYHKNELDKFIENVNLNISDIIRIVQVTSRGEIIIKDVEFNKDKFIIKIDNRWDVDLPEEDRKIVTNEYDAKNYKLVKESVIDKNNNLKTYYKINLVSNNKLSSIYVCDYIETKVNNEANFELEFNKDSTEGRKLILSKSETSKYDYDMYSYNGTVNIIIDGEKLTLRDALLTNKITMDEILKKAERDAEEYKTIYMLGYADGGSKAYYYFDYTILKLNSMTFIPIREQENIHTEYHNKDLYIGNPWMGISEIEEYYRNM